MTGTAAAEHWTRQNAGGGRGAPLPGRRDPGVIP